MFVKSLYLGLLPCMMPAGDIMAQLASEAAQSAAQQQAVEMCNEQIGVLTGKVSTLQEQRSQAQHALEDALADVAEMRIQVLVWTGTSVLA